MIEITKPPSIPVPAEERRHIVVAPPPEAAAPDSNLHRSRDKRTWCGSSFTACGSKPKADFGSRLVWSLFCRWIDRSMLKRGEVISAFGFVLVSIRKFYSCGQRGLAGWNVDDRYPFFAEYGINVWVIHSRVEMKECSIFVLTQHWNWSCFF